MFSLLPSLRRTIDVALAAALGVVLAPLGAAIAGAIWLDDGRPVLFSQTRCGRGGVPFTLWKFRSLHTGPKDATRPADYTTRVGRVLRRWGLDEMPQLVNVLRGEMRLVGPRPVPPDQVARYGPHERRRLQVRPGLTGWAQIHGRNALSWPDRIALDLWYVRHRSLALDLRILLATPVALLRGTGTTGPDRHNPAFRAADRSNRSARPDDASPDPSAPPFDRPSLP